MLKPNLASFVFLLGAAAAAGCAADAPDDDGGDGDGGGGGGGGDVEDVPLTPEGRFAVQSEFDVATNLPGTPGRVVNYFIEATDDPDDPTKFLVDELIKALPDGQVKNYAEGAAPFITGYLNDRLLEVAPELVTKLVEVGDAFGQAARNFGTTELLEITASGNATKTVTGLHFKIDNVDLEFAFKDYGIAETKVEGLTVQLTQTGQLGISEHKVPLEYGQVLKLALNQAIIPLIDPSAQDLGDLLAGVIDCQAVGQYVYEAIDIGSPSTFESACNSGITAASAALYKQMDNIDTAALEFGLTGTARGLDKNKDGKMDDILTGTWTGQLTYSGSPAPLADAKFHGSRM